MSQLKEKVILITGSAVRIGRILSLGLADAQLILHYHHSKDEALCLKQELEKQGANPFLFQADLSHKNEIQMLFECIKKHFGKLDVLINNAATLKKVDFLNEEDLSSSLKINLEAPLICSQLAYPLMQAGSSIINIIDQSAHVPFKGFAMHSISKAALKHASKALADEFAPKVRVNNLLLGACIPSKDQIESFDKLIEKHCLLKRPPTEKEIVDAAQSLILNDYFNATTLHLDGGWQ